MALRGHVFDKQLFSSNAWALVTDVFLDKHSGVIKGCDLSNTSSSIYIDEGYFLVKGRPLQEEGGSTIEVEAGDLSGIYCKLICEVDMNKTNTTSQFNQAEYKIVEDSSDYPELNQEDLNDGGKIYQFEFAQFRRTLNGIEDFVDTRSFLNFDSIYTEIEQEIRKIEEGSIFALKDDTYNKSEIDEKIENLTTYSTTKEIKTGETWIDEKPIYRKSFNITLPTTGAKKYELDISSLNIETGMFDMNNSYYYDTTYQRYYPICVTTVASSGAGTAASNLQSIVYYNSNYTKIIAECGHTSNWKLVITLRYTKTTD